MERLFPFAALLALCLVLAVPMRPYAEAFETDAIETSAGALTITFIGHGSLMFSFNGQVIHVDPDSRLVDYSQMPKADLILVTHEHKDHCDPAAIAALTRTETAVVANAACADQLKNAIVLGNGETKTVKGLSIQAVPAYNVVHMRQPETPFHPRGVGNGYIITFGDKRLYIAGDTEDIPEMQELKGVDIAFLPMNLPYTMTPEMAAKAAEAVKPRILYPYHYGDTDTARIVELLKGSGIDVRIRQMK